MTKPAVTPDQLQDEALSLYRSGAAKNINDAAEILIRNHLDFNDLVALDTAVEAAWRTYTTPVVVPTPGRNEPTVHPNGAPGTVVTGSNASVDTTAPSRSAPEPSLAPQPNPEGEFATPLDGALWMATRWQIRQIPVAPRQKFPPCIEGWPEKASSDPEQIRAWWKQFPGCNFASVAGDTHLIFEVDVPDLKPQDYLAVSERYRKTTNAAFTSKLLVMSSTPERGHRYYLALPGLFEKTIAQSDTKHGDFSLRVHNAYCITPGSVHPSGAQYRVVMNSSVGWPGAPTHPTQPEINFWNSERKSEEKRAPISDEDDAPIPTGQRNDTICSILGKIHYAAGGASYDVLIEAARDINQRRCDPPLDDTELQTIARSVSKYPVKIDQFAEQAAVRAKRDSEQAQETQPELEVDTSGAAVRPVFPVWVMKGTSLYEGLAKTVSDVNSKYPELIWMPGVQIMLNHLQGRVGIEGLNLNLNLYLGVISPPGKFFKSSSCELAQKYFETISLTENYSDRIRNADEKVVITQAGSSEGLGLSLSRIHATHAIVYYDELAKFVSKAGIQCASIAHDLLTWYESGKFENLIKAKKETFTFAAHSYIFGWLWCTTNRLFREYWSQLTKEESGLVDRMFFLLTPEKPKPLVPEKQVNYLEGLMVTKNRIEAAINRKQFTLYDDFFDELYDVAADMAARFGDPRSMNMVYKLALYFAVDLGRKSIDIECLERAVDLVKYRNQAIAHIAPIEAQK